MSEKLIVNPIECKGNGACAELLPEMISLDEWGYPIIDSQPIPPALDRDARAAVSACPTLALRLLRSLFTFPNGPWRLPREAVDRFRAQARTVVLDSAK
jgi:ferredoxin